MPEQLINPLEHLRGELLSMSENYFKKIIPILLNEKEAKNLADQADLENFLNGKLFQSNIHLTKSKRKPGTFYIEGKVNTEFSAKVNGRSRNYKFEINYVYFPAGHGGVPRFSFDELKDPISFGLYMANKGTKLTEI